MLHRISFLLHVGRSETVFVGGIEMRYHDTDQVTELDNEYIADAVARISAAIHAEDDE